MRARGVQSLLMGGQACVSYGAAEFSRDVDLALLADATNLARLRTALEDLVRQVPTQAATSTRPAVAAARAGDLTAISRALGEEEELERERDRAYWRPLRQELERLRRGHAE